MKSKEEASMPAVAVVAVNWNGGRDCEAMLNSIRAQAHPPAEVVVVDNGSSDGSRQWFADQPDVRLVGNPGNWGFSRAVNQGLRATTSAYVVLCNLDVELDPGFIAAAVARAESAPDIGSVGGRLRGAG
ncbi:MAG: glycosyltransferase, partial [Candidatus Dormiibacterota bacterium]